MSRYFKHAQATINCDHCGGVNDVKHYCLICEETICSTCKAIHNKARATRDHQVVLREERHTKDQTSTFCKKHPDQKTSLHCDTCNVPVCTKCIAETHYGHRFSDIAKVLMTFHKKLLHSKRLMQDRMKQINFLIKREEQNWHDYESAVKVLESCIKRDASTLKSMVDKLEQGRTNELESIKRHDRKAWEAVKGRLEEEKTKIYSCLAQHDECLSSQTTAGMTELLNESIILQNTSINPMKVTAPSYRSSHAASVEGIGDIIMNANIQTRVPVDNLNVFKAKVISSFSCKLMGVPAMCYFGNGLVMISTKDSSDIQMVDIQGNVVQKREMVLKDKCWSLAVHNSGDIIVSPIGRQRIENLGSQNLLKTLLDTSPYTPHFVTVTQKQEILVCLCKYNFDTNEGRVMLFDKKGGNKRYLTNNNAYEYPIQAIDLPGEGFCISDKYKERLIVLDKDFNVKHTIQKPLGQNEFWPQGICTDKAGNILATDKKNDCVYLIRKNMNVELLVGVTHGIKDPKCLCVDDDNNLWIAQWNGEIKFVKYLQ